MTDPEDLMRQWSKASQKQAAEPQIKPNLAAQFREREYVAFDTRDNPERLHILAATGPSRLPALSYLLDVPFDHDFQTGFTLVFTFMSVKVTGENLGPIFHALHWGNCERIIEYHPKLYPTKPPAGEPIITKIEVQAVAYEPPSK